MSRKKRETYNVVEEVDTRSTGIGEWELYYFIIINAHSKHEVFLGFL